MARVIVSRGTELDIPVHADILEMEQTIDTMYTAFIDHDLSNDRQLRSNVNCSCSMIREFMKQLKELTTGNIR